MNLRQDTFIFSGLKLSWATLELDLQVSIKEQNLAKSMFVL